MNQSILTLFNKILNDEEFPHIWEKGYIVPILKNGDLYDPANYRGITISDCLGKLFTKIMNTRLMDFLIENKII